jgi:DNA-binding NarL/FixJ family response regulator
MDESISMVVVDDEAITAAAMAALCRTIAGVRVVGHASSGHHGLALIEELLPTVALVDLLMPGLDGIELTSLVRQKGFPSGVLILTGCANEDLCLRAMRIGASGYLLKMSLQEELEIAIRAVADGNTYITPAMARSFVNESSRSPQAKSLTQRQRETLDLVVQGKTNKEIAGALNVSVKTVEKHRAELMRRLNVHSTAGLVSYAISHRVALGTT